MYTEQIEETKHFWNSICPSNQIPGQHH